MIYRKEIPSIGGGMWGWFWKYKDRLFLTHANYKSYEDAMDNLETFMVNEWMTETKPAAHVDLAEPK